VLSLAQANHFVMFCNKILLFITYGCFFNWVHTRQHSPIIMAEQPVQYI